ncbi:fimbrial protein [Bordetella trematum]|uniref:fimbrial protein n=1 Tax=Bordetella trematum TaxID=123899 RepID=UPI000D9362E8|nr:fimbrial protein [Bordetella trematum]SPU49137.1 fimbrial subunit [Bordetella trematum]VDH04105.1 Fimbrial subunit ElfA precursor [Bordetella trematum]
MKTQQPPIPAPGWPVRLACLSLALAPFSTALAVDGTITINGEIIDSTCKINGKNAPVDFIVNLPKISTSALPKKGDVAGATLFVLTLTECPASLSGEVKAHFEPGVTTDYATGNLYAYKETTVKTTAESSIPNDRATAMKAENVEIQLANTDGSAINIGAPDSKAKGATLQNGSDSKKTATLRYLAQYIKSGESAITPGKLVTYVQYSIVYP